MSSPATFVRLVVARQDENPFWETGIFTVARQFRDDGKLDPYEVERLNEIYA